MRGLVAFNTDFVEDKERAVFIARSANSFPVIRRWNEWNGTNGFADDSRHVAFLLQNVVNVIGASEGTSRAAFEGTMAIVGGGNVFAAGQQRANVPAKERFAPDRYGIQGRAMKRVPHGNKFEPARGHARELQSCANGSCSTGSQQNAVQARGR